jgi:hypothetical protein
VRTGLVWLLQPVAFLVALGAIHASGADFPWVGLWFAGSWAFAAALVFVPMLPRLRLGSLDRAHLGKVVRFSLKSHANVAMSQLNYRLDMFVVAYLVSDLGQLAFYHVAASLAGLIWLLPDTYGVALYPRLAGAGSARERTRQVIEALRLVGLVSIAAAAALAALAGWGVPLADGGHEDPLAATAVGEPSSVVRGLQPRGRRRERGGEPRAGAALRRGGRRGGGHDRIHRDLARHARRRPPGLADGTRRLDALPRARAGHAPSDGPRRAAATARTLSAAANEGTAHRGHSDAEARPSSTAPCTVARRS